LNPALANKQFFRLPGFKFLQVLSDRRTLIYQMVRRDFTQRFVGSAAGVLWTVIHPVVLLLSWVFVFQWCLKIPPPPGAGDHYTLYIYCGYLPWMLFQETIQRSASTLTEHASLITKTVFPSEILVVVTYLSNLLTHIIAVTIAVLAIRFITGHFSVLTILLPFWTLLLGLFAVGLGWIFASLQVYIRDTAQAVAVALTGWFWITPIFIDETMFPDKARFLVHYNPIAYVVRAYRIILLGQGMPLLSDYLTLAVICTATFFAGGLFFRHLKRGFADVL
jgi:lipopolysaccharide transport system permease protein